MLWTLKKIWYRIYQNVFKVAMCFMDWSEPELLEGAGSVLKLPEFIKNKGINKVLVVTDGGLMGLHLLDPMFAKLDEAGVEYVVYDGRVFYPETDVNADTPQVGQNLSLHDPRNYNLKKHMVRLAIYELTKLIAPNNVSVVRMRDYEDSMKWLNDAAKLRLNPQIPRKVDDSKKPVTDWQLATFQTDYDPYKNPWMV